METVRDVWDGVTPLRMELCLRRGTVTFLVDEKTFE